MGHVLIIISNLFRCLTTETEKYVNENRFIGILAGLKYSMQAKSRRQANQSKGLTLGKMQMMYGHHEYAKSHMTSFSDFEQALASFHRKYLATVLL